MFDFIFFNLKTLCVISAGVIAVMLWGNQKLNQRGTLTLFLGLTLCSLWTMYNYVFPSQRFFSNTDYHCLEHEGFKFKDELSLVNESERETALWDNPDHKGNLALQSVPKTADFKLHSEGFTEPIFVQEAGHNFKLANLIFEQRVQQNIEIEMNTFYVKINMYFFKNPTWMKKLLGKQVYPDSARYICTVKLADGTVATDTSSFNAPLKQGYSIGDILAKTAHLPEFPVGLSDMMEKTYLMRPYQNRVMQNHNFEHDLVLMPSPELMSVNPTIRLDGKPQTKLGISSIKKDIILKNGRKFYVGFGMNQSPILRTAVDNGNQLLYEFGDKKPLKQLTPTDKGLFMTSDSRSVVENDAVAGYYYPLFDSDSNIHHFRGSLQYFMGNAKEKLTFRMFDYDNEHGAVSDTIVGRTIALHSYDADGVTWLFKINDLRAQNPLKWWQMMAFMWCFFLGAMVCLRADTHHSTTEVVVYIVLMTLLTIRCVLLWRMVTFPPYEDINYVMYQQMVEPSKFLGYDTHTLRHFQNTILTFLCFFATIFLFKKKIIPNKSDAIRDFFSKITTWFYEKPLAQLGIALGGYILIGIVKTTFSELERFGSILIPVSWFFLMDYFFKSNQNKVADEGGDISEINNFRLLRILNWVLAFGFFAANDAGFGAIFSIFNILYIVLRTLFRGSDIFGTKKIRYGLPLGALVVILMSAPFVMSFLFWKPQLTAALIALILLFVAAGLQLLPKKLDSFAITDEFKKYAMILSVALIPIAGLIFQYGAGVINKKVYIKYRAEILFKKVDDIILGEAADSKNSQKIMEAAQNQWYIAYHQSKAQSVGWGSFNLSPHFQKGSSYVTQSTDLVTVRYVIGEHGEILILLVLLLWFGIVLSIERQGGQNPFKGTLMAVSVLLLSISLFIWMAATNRFIFFGQDMPLLSLQSLLTLVLAATFLGFIVIGQHGLVSAELENYGDAAHGTVQKSVRASGTLLFILMIVATLNKSYSKDIDSFDIADTMDNVEALYDRLNEQFETFQKTSFTPKELSKLSAKKVLELFDAREKITADKPSENAILQDKFSRSLFSKLLKEDVHRISPNKILHLRKPEDKYWRFAINNQYYRLRSPEMEKNAWKGDILAPIREDVAQFNVRIGKTYHPVPLEANKPKPTLMNDKGFDALRQQIPNIGVAFLPGSWTPDSQHLVILRTEGTVDPTIGFRKVIQNSQEVIDGADPAVNSFAYALKNHDVVRFLNDKAKNGKNESNKDRYRLDYARSDVDYWAKNVWLNGKQRFFYPAGEKCLWAYHFANLMNHRHSQLKTPAEKASNEFKSVEVTLDPTLTKQMYDDLKRHYRSTTPFANYERVEKDRGFNLVAMDGDGHISLMADYKKGLSPSEIINPNKMERYQDLMDKLYLKSQISKEMRIFGNGCLQFLNPGPGSSFKPIVYDAVTSAYNFNWDDLYLTPPVTTDPNVLETGGDHCILKRYSGQPIPEWSFLSGDRNFIMGSSGLCSSKEYLPHSSNVYHSLIVLIGSHTRAQVADARNTFLKPSETLSLQDRIPQIRYGNRLYGFRSDWIKMDMSTNASLLAIGLTDNYRLPLFMRQLSKEARNEQINLMKGFDAGDAFFMNTNSSYKLWSFPGCSMFSQVDRQKDVKSEGLKQSTLGAFPVQVTPLKMAEMTGKMFSANPGFRATIWNRSPKSDTLVRLSVDASWGGEQAFLDFKGKTIFYSMHQQAAGGDGSGTGGSTRARIQQYEREKGWYFYGKSGTINYPYELNGTTENSDNKLYTIVISKKALHGATGLTREMLKDNRFYVLYFSINRINLMKTGVKDEVKNLLLNSIDKVVNSASFKNYMK